MNAEFGEKARQLTGFDPSKAPTTIGVVRKNFPAERYSNTPPVCIPAAKYSPLGDIVSVQQCRFGKSIVPIRRPVDVS